MPLAESSRPGAADRSTTWLGALGPPFAAFAAQRAVALLCCWYAGRDPLSADAWVHWDAGFYLDLAANGYQAPVHCPPALLLPPEAWCGNTSWFPGYPWAMALVARLGASLPLAALGVSAAAQLGCLLLLWRLLGRTARDWPALLLGAFFFGGIYYAAPFPVSLALLLLLGVIHFFLEQRFVLAAVCAGLAATTYPAAAFVLPAVLLWGAQRREARVLLVAAGVLLGLAAVFATLQLQAGSWRAFSQTQANFHYSGNALDTLFSRLKPLVNPRYRGEKGVVTGLQTLLVLGLVSALAANARRLWAEERARIIVYYTAVFWLVPLALGGQLSLYRSESLLLPCALLVPRLPRALQLSLAGAAVAIFVPMAVLFFRDVLV